MHNAVLIALLVCVVSQADDSFRVAPREPAEALKTFQLRPGFHIELVAAEPLIRDPVAMAFDEFGRIYVVEYPEFNEYAFKPPKPSGAIKLLEDKDDDARYEKSTTFLDKVAFPTSVICYDGGVFIGAAPDVLYCKDTDGDGRADVRKKVLTGFARDFAGGGLLNSFHWGLDNRIHIATSFAGGEIRRADRPDDEAVSVRSRGMVFDPRTGDFELTSGGGQHGMGIDDFGRKFLCSNVHPMQLLMYDGRYIARNPLFAPPAAAVNINGEGRLAKLHRISPLEPWRIERSKTVAASRPDDEGSRPGGLFTSSSGITIYRGDAWPEEYHGNLFVGEVTNNLVYRAKLESDRLGLVALRADKDVEFLASTDIWYRPVQFANGPDGNLFVVDMYRELIEGAAFVPKRMLEKIDPASGTDRGRIYRIVYVGQADQPVARTTTDRLGSLCYDELVGLLEHPNGWHRDTAARLLYERQDRRAATELKKLAANSKLPVARVHAMCALDGLGQLSSEIVLPRLADSHPDVRIHALRLAESIVSDAPELRAKMYSMTDDDNPRVRYQLAFSLGAVLSCLPRNEALAQLAVNHAESPWMRTAVQSSLAHGAGDILSALSSKQKFRTSDEGQRMLGSLAAQIGAGGRSSEIALLLKSLASIPDNERSTKKMISSAMLRRASGEVKRQFLTADSSKLLASLTRDARKIAVDDDAPIDARVEAVQTLSLAKFDRWLFSELIQLRQPPRIQSAAVRSMAKIDDPGVATLIHKSWPRLSPMLRAQAIETLFARDHWTLATLELVTRKTIALSDFQRSRLVLLKDHPNTRIRRLAEKLLQSLTPGRDRIVAAYQTSLRMNGDVDRGKALFKKNCAACHKLDGDGKSVGADLAGIGNRPAEATLADILDPNRELKPKFASYVLVTNDGRTVAGMIVEETANSIRLVRADGSSETILRVSIENLRSTGLSFMPEGLEKQIDSRSMADLLAYLATFR